MYLMVQAGRPAFRRARLPAENKDPRLTLIDVHPVISKWSATSRKPVRQQAAKRFILPAAPQASCLLILRTDLP